MADPRALSNALLHPCARRANGEPRGRRRQYEIPLTDEEAKLWRERLDGLLPAADGVVADLVERIYGFPLADLRCASYWWGRISPAATWTSVHANVRSNDRSWPGSPLSRRRLTEAFVGGRVVISRGVWIPADVYGYRVDGDTAVRHIHVDIDYDDYEELRELKARFSSAISRGEVPAWGLLEAETVANHPGRQADRTVLEALGFHTFTSKSTGLHAWINVSRPVHRDQLRMWLAALDKRLCGRVESTNVGRYDGTTWSPRPNLLPFPTAYPHQRAIGPVDAVQPLPVADPLDLMPDHTDPPMPPETWIPPVESPVPAISDESAAEAYEPTLSAPLVPEALVGQLAETLRRTITGGRPARSSERAERACIEIEVTDVPSHCWWLWIHATGIAFHFDPEQYPAQVAAMSRAVSEDVLQERIAKVGAAVLREQHRWPALNPRTLSTDSPVCSQSLLHPWLTSRLVARLWAAACEAYPPNRKTRDRLLEDRRLDIANALLVLVLEVRRCLEPIFFCTLCRQMRLSGYLSRHCGRSFRAAKACYMRNVVARLSDWIPLYTDSEGRLCRLYNRYDGQRHGMLLFQGTPRLLELSAMLPPYSGSRTSVFEVGQVRPST